MFIDTLQARRDVFVLGGEVVIVQHYSKTSSRAGGKLRPRFLLPDTGELVVAICRLVVPMRTFATIMLKRPIDGSGDRGGECFLFSGNEKAQGRPRDHINAALQRAGIDMALRAYRQWQSGIARAMRAAGRTNQAALVAITLLDADIDGEELSVLRRPQLNRPDTLRRLRQRTTAEVLLTRRMVQTQVTRFQSIVLHRARGRMSSGREGDLGGVKSP
jgi:hypothetical protein